MKAYEFKAYVQNNQMTLPKDYGEILNNKSVRVIVLERETIKEEPSSAPQKEPITTTRVGVTRSTCIKPASAHPHRQVRQRTQNADKELKSLLDELKDY